MSNSRKDNHEILDLFKTYLAEINVNIQIAKNKFVNAETDYYSIKSDTEKKIDTLVKNSRDSTSEEQKHHNTQTIEELTTYLQWKFESCQSSYREYKACINELKSFKDLFLAQTQDAINSNIDSINQKEFKPSSTTARLLEFFKCGNKGVLSKADENVSDKSQESIQTPTSSRKL